MEMTRNHTEGSVRISENAIIKIAKIAALEIPGVAGVYRGMPELNTIRFNKTMLSPIVVTMKDGTVMLDIHLKLQYDAQLRKTCEAVQAGIKNAVQNTTGITVSRVNVYVDGIRLETEMKQ